MDEPNPGLVVPVVLAGGIGSRLWPLSRELFPKQFHSLFGHNSLLQNTLRRSKLVTSAAPLVVCNEEHRFLVAEQCREIDQQWGQIILEPEGRSTAPAIALAAYAALEKDPNAILLVLVSDHLIEDIAAFGAAVAVAVEEAATKKLVTFGVSPTRPETGYGYIQVASDYETNVAQPVRSFVEKPDLAAAEKYLADGKHLWNSGSFVLHAQTYLDELASFHPQITQVVARAYGSGKPDLDFFRPDASFADSPSISIDYGVMERTQQATVVPVDYDWTDVGSWSSVWQSSERCADGNSFNGDVVAVDTQGSYVRADSRMIGVLGVKDLIVVETSDAVLVAEKTRAEDVKSIVAELQRSDRQEFYTHREVFRPWGSYESIATGAGYQAKRICVKPGATLSLQKHTYRAEHWIVVKGEAEVTRDDEVFGLKENESTYIPLGVRHRLHNPGDAPLELVEVQVGSYLGEDDIERFEDIYGR